MFKKNKELDEKLDRIEEKLDIILDVLLIDNEEFEEEEELVRVPSDVYKKIEDFIGEEPSVMGIS